MNYTGKANPNATNSELDAKIIITHNELTSLQKDELIEQYVELVVDNMDIKSMMQYITDDLTDVYNDYSDDELKDQIEMTIKKGLYHLLTHILESLLCNRGINLLYIIRKLFAYFIEDCF